MFSEAIDFSDLDTGMSDLNAGLPSTAGCDGRVHGGAFYFMAHVAPPSIHATPPVSHATPPPPSPPCLRSSGLQAAPRWQRYHRLPRRVGSLPVLHEERFEQTMWSDDDDDENSPRPHKARRVLVAELLASQTGAALSERNEPPAVL